MAADPFHQLSPETQQRLRALEAASELFPCIVIVHSIPDASTLWMSARGLRLLHTTNEALRALGPNYTATYFNPEDADHYVPKIMGLMQRADPDETVSFFQQVRYGPGEPYHWYLSVTQIFAFDETGAPSHIITTALPIDTAHHLSLQAARLLEENNFLRANLRKLQSLGRRETEVLHSIASGASNKEIAAALHLSEATVATHRRNLKRKLGAATTQDLTRYAQAAELL